MLTDLLRTASTGSGLGELPRGVLHFASLMRPSDDEWLAYQNETLDWNDLSWPLGENSPGPQALYGIDSAMRQVWLRTELQLVVGTASATTTPPYVPFFGSSALYYQLSR